MNRKHVFILASIAAVMFSAIAVSSQNDDSKEEAKSVAWYVANLQDANQQNQQCFDNPAIRNEPNCLNSRRALEISFKNGSYTGSRLN
ncbi:hypothetical protein [Methylocucumis oryzae]|uniref:Uncharacterized protein n=1 Tax=Methylocucumis oryzae TaxID=1632867 RepID=A0A0F3IPG9_9GAMM|nr:hypothetical protein [Methylocucumis oryzae]KJV07494.1 hypothetical protein VZ94_04375 [Methylocucumis oryzae]